MKAGKKGEGSERSGLTRNKLFGALGHVHNPFSTNSHGSHDVEDNSQDESIRKLGIMSLQVEMTRAEAFLAAQNLVSRIQKS